MTQQLQMSESKRVLIEILERFSYLMNRIDKFMDEEDQTKDKRDQLAWEIRHFYNLIDNNVDYLSEEDCKKLNEFISNFHNVLNQHQERPTSFFS